MRSPSSEGHLVGPAERAGDESPGRAHVETRRRDGVPRRRGPPVGVRGDEREGAHGVLRRRVRRHRATPTAGRAQGLRHTGHAEERRHDRLRACGRRRGQDAGRRRRRVCVSGGMNRATTESTSGSSNTAARAPRKSLGAGVGPEVAPMGDLQPGLLGRVLGEQASASELPTRATRRPVGQRLRRDERSDVEHLVDRVGADHAGAPEERVHGGGGCLSEPDEVPARSVHRGTGPTSPRRPAC